MCISAIHLIFWTVFVAFFLVLGFVEFLSHVRFKYVKIGLD